MANVAHRLRKLGREDFSEVLNLTGRVGFTRLIKVVLISEGTPLAKEAPPWVAGYSRGDRSTIVLFPQRVPAYPDRNLRVLLRHEIAHLLVWEATSGRPVPRWLGEGVATVAAREWGLEDRARYSAAVIGGGPRSTRQLDRAFGGTAIEVRRAYALSAGFVRFVQIQFGSLTVARVLDELAEGENIETAFFSATGAELRDVEKRFFRERALWNTWVPFLTSAGALWMAVTLLALVAILRRRAKSQAMRGRWEAEEEAFAAPQETEEIN